MNDLRHDPDAEVDSPSWLGEQAAELEARKFLRQWQPVPPGVPCWGRTVMHTPDGNTYTNVDPPALEPPDLRTVGDKLDELTSTVEAERINLRLLLQRVEALESALERKVSA